MLIPSWASGESVVKGNLGNVNRGTRSASRGDGDDSFEDVSKVASDIIAAGLVGSEAESSTTFDSARWAITPADRANTIGTVLAGWVTQASIILLTWSTGQRSASSATIGFLGA